MVRKSSSQYDILARPRITEKTAILGSTSNCVVFDVVPSASKLAIQNAVEKIFDVKVKSVRTAQYKGKLKRVGRSLGHQKDWKKAYVFLAPGSELNLVEGL